MVSLISCWCASPEQRWSFRSKWKSARTVAFLRFAVALCCLYDCLLLPQLARAQTYTFKKLASFPANQNFGNVQAGLIMDSSGNLYGTTQLGGNLTLNNGLGDGTVYKIAAGTNALTTLVAFSGSNGDSPLASLIMDSDGNLYGTTGGGGANLAGTVFKIDAGTNTLTTLVSFDTSTGYGPEAALIMDGSGNLYGTTDSSSSQFGGRVFKIAAGTNALTTLATFSLGINHPIAVSGLIMDSSGNLYGTTELGGDLTLNGGSGYGSVFKIAAGTNALTTLATFNGPNGEFPVASLVMDSDGNLYGTTSQGGDLSLNNGIGDGTVFKVAAGTNALTTLVAFDGTNGWFPLAGLLLADGNLYGAASGGGDLTLFGGFGAGTVFKIALDTNVLTTLFSFNDSTTGVSPAGTLIRDASGNLYGTTEAGGGPNVEGTVFELVASASAPTITSFTPTLGPVGTKVTITGTAFTGATAVRFNGTPSAFTVVSGTSITATVPTGATTGPISVTTPGGTATSADSFTVIPVPAITSFAPPSGPIGTKVTITGTGFTGATTVKFNGIAATQFTVNSATSITATVPASATTGSISVTTPGGTATSASKFTVTVVLASFTISPATIAPGGTLKATVTLSGPAPSGGASIEVTYLGFAVARVAVPTGAATGSVNMAGPAAAGSYTFDVSYGGVTLPAMVTVTKPVSVKALTFSPSSIAAGASTMGTVTLSAAPAAPAVVTIALDGFTVATVTVKAGATSGIFPLTTSVGTPSGARVFTATYSGSSANGTLTIHP